MTKTMYLSKYALTSGVQQVQIKEISPEGYAYQEGPYWNSLAVGRDVHETFEAAAVAADAARVKKIASLKKQIAKLEKLSFSKGQP